MSAAGTPQGPGAQQGDWVEVSGIPGKRSRRGQVVEVLGDPGHEHYRVRWEEQRESLLYPGEGVHVLRDDELGAAG